jgi:hypothetical protein
MRRHTGRLIAAMAAVLVVGAGAALPVAAGVPGDPYGEGDRTGAWGLHWILDSAEEDPEYPAATCRYDALGRLTAIKIVQPVLFAEVSGGPRTQQVGWRADVYSVDSPVGGSGDPVGSTSVSRAFATGKLPADLLPKTWKAGADATVHQAYRIVYRLFWYDAEGDVTGTAAHWPYTYGETDGSFRELNRQRCPSQRKAVPANVGPAGWDPILHAGKPGKHWLLDNVGPNPQYPAITCRFDETGMLTGIRARRPIVLARDAGAGIQSQDVGWVLRVEGALTEDDAQAEDFQPIASTPMIRKRATERLWADFLPRTVSRTSAWSSYHAVRLVYRLRWYAPGGTKPKGTAEHAARWHARDLDGTLDDSAYAYCVTDLDR